MSDVTGVYLITGFLGAGKTTFLNRIINRFPKDKKMTLLVNEFGEVGVDGTLVQGDDIDMMEISKGSIFCVCVKTDFIKGLYELNAKVQPDVLLIESTGVANPSDLKKDLQLPIFNNRFVFKEQFCLVDATHFLDAFEVYVSLEKQIASSSVFIINKTDTASAETISKIKDIIKEFHPDPLFFETSYADIPLDRFFELESGQAGRSDPQGSMPVMSSDELDKFIDDLLDSPDLEITPPDLLMSVAYRWSGHRLADVEAMADALPATVVRAKGFVESADGIKLFNFVMGDWTIETPLIALDRIEHPNVVVFIGPPESMKEIETATQNGNWANLGTYQPYQE